MNSRQRLNWLNSARRDIQASLRSLRIQQKMSQAELAKKMSVPVDQSTISNWESGKTIMDLEQLLDILMIFGKDWKSFFGFLADNAEKRTIKKPQQKEPPMEPETEDKGED